jgi:hypothetical protein
VVVLSDDAWKNEFAADPGAVGRRLRLNGVDFTIVGIAPKRFTGMDQYIRPMFYVPAMMGPKLLAANRDMLTDRANRGFTVKGRLKPMRTSSRSRNRWSNPSPIRTAPLGRR